MKSSLIPRPLPRIARFEKMGFGLFLHWGLYSLLGKGEWIQAAQKIGSKKYEPLMKRFDAQEFDARRIASLAKAAGMKYVILTTRHHDGFSLYDTQGLSKYDAPHAAAGRDLIAEFAEGCRAEGVIPFFYHTTIDWTWDPELKGMSGKKWDAYLDYFHASVEVLCKNYGKIGGLWFDGNWAYPKADWKEDRLYALIRKHQPEAMIVNNTGLHELGKCGNPEIDSVTYEQSLPRPIDRKGAKKYLAGETCQTMNKHWGIGFEDFDFLSPAKVIENLALTRKVGANYVLNIGPTASGAIPGYEAESLRVVGRWMDLYQEAIREGKPTEIRASGRDFVLRGEGVYYYFAFDLPIRGNAAVVVAAGNLETRPLENFDARIRSVEWMDLSSSLSFTQNRKAKIAGIEWKGFDYGQNHVVRVAKIRVS